jgi:serine/threonine protein kinase
VSEPKDTQIDPQLDAQAQETDAAAEEPHFQRYVVKKLIGVGGMAEVFLAQAERKDGRRRPVVLKRVKKEHAQNQKFLQMFLDEAKLSARMDHKNIVKVYEYGQFSGVHYLSMEYIDGVHLQEFHRRHEVRFKTPLPWPAVAVIISAVLRGLDYAHKLTDEQGNPLGLIHRDVNMDNVMIARDGAVKLLDFGIVKARQGIRAAETAAGVLKGKFGYMSPEQVAGKALEPNSDVFSASICMHELLTGHRLFWGDDDLSILMAVKSGPIRDPREHNPKIPPPLVDILMRGLERKVERRYPAAAEMADALDELLESHHMDQSLVGMLAQQLIQPPKKLTAEQKRRQRKMTLEAWRHGTEDSAKTSEMEQRPRVTSGSLGSLDSLDNPLAEAIAAATSSGTDPQWKLPQTNASTRIDQTPPQMASGTASPTDQGAATRIDEAPHTLEEQTRIEENGKASAAIQEQGPALSEQKTVMLEDTQPPTAPAGPAASTAPAGPALSEQKTVMLEDTQPPTAPASPAGPALSEQKTVMLEDAQPDRDPTDAVWQAHPSAQEGTPKEAAPKETAPKKAAEKEAAEKEAAPDGKRLIYVTVAAAAAAVVFVVLYFVLS